MITLLALMDEYIKLGDLQIKNIDSLDTDHARDLYFYLRMLKHKQIRVKELIEGAEPDGIDEGMRLRVEINRIQDKIYELMIIITQKNGMMKKP